MEETFMVARTSSTTVTKKPVTEQKQQIEEWASFVDLAKRAAERFIKDIERSVRLSKAQFELVQRSLDAIGEATQTLPETLEMLEPGRIQEKIHDYITEQAFLRWEQWGKPPGRALESWVEVEKSFWGPLYPLREVTADLANTLSQASDQQKDKATDYWLAAEKAVFATALSVWKTVLSQKEKASPNR
jgi:hypothetical protein